MISRLLAKQDTVGISGKSGASGLVDYMHEGKDGERATHKLCRGVSSFEAAGREMDAVARRAGREPSSSVHHIVVSLRKDERPTFEQFKDIVEKHVEALGFDEHQCAAAMHEDTDNIHIHICIEEVNPNTFFCYRPRENYYHMARACRELEERHGFERDPGIVAHDRLGGWRAADRNQITALRSMVDGAHKVRQFRGEVPFQEWIVTNRDALGRLIDGCSCWQEANERMSAIGLRFAKFERGLAIVNDAGNAIKLSSLNREEATRTEQNRDAGLYSIKRLERKFGEPFVSDRRSIDLQAAACIRHLSEGEATFSIRQVDAWLASRTAEADWAAIKKTVVDTCVSLKAENGQPPRLCSRDTWDSEQRAHAAIVTLLASPADKISDDALNAGIEDRRQADKRKGVGMNAEQTAGMIHCLKSRISVVVGDPGTGKSFMLLGVKAAIEATGGRVIGAGPNNVVRDSLKTDGIKSYTVDRLLIDIERGEVDLGRQNGMRLKVLIDETGLIDNPKTEKLLEKAVEHDFDIVMIGDPKQIPSVGQGGLFQDIIDIAGHARLKEIVRQKDETQRDAVKKMAERDFGGAVELLDRQGRIEFADTAKESRIALMDARRKDFDADPSRPAFIFAFKNSDCDWLNAESHDMLRDAGVVADCKKYRLERKTFEIGIGDAVMMTKNVSVKESGQKTRLTNGMRGIVTATHQDYLEVKFADDDMKSPIRIPVDRQTPMPVSLAYAGTVHRGQGKTLPSVLLLHDAYWKDSASFVALSRQTDDVRVFANKENVADIKEMAAQMARSMAKRSAMSYGEADQRHECKPIRKSDALSTAKKIDAETLRDFQKKYEQEYKPEYDAEYLAWAKGKAERLAERDRAIEAAEGKAKARVAAGEPRAAAQADRRAEIATAKAAERAADTAMPRLLAFKQWLRAEAKVSPLAAEALARMEGKWNPGKARPAKIERSAEDRERVAVARAALAAERTQEHQQRQPEPEERRIPPPFFRGTLRALDEIPTLQDMISAHDRPESDLRHSAQSEPSAPPAQRTGWQARAEAAQREAQQETPSPPPPPWWRTAAAEVARAIGLGPREPPPPPDPERLLEDARTAMTKAGGLAMVMSAKRSNNEPIGKHVREFSNRLAEAERLLKAAYAAGKSELTEHVRDGLDDAKARFDGALREASAAAAAVGINLAEGDFGSSTADVLEAVACMKAEALRAKEAAERAECSQPDGGLRSDARRMIAEAERAFSTMPSSRAAHPHAAEIRAALDAAETSLERADRIAKREAARAAALAKAEAAIGRAEARAAVYHEDRQHEIPWVKDGKNLRGTFRSAQEVVEAAETAGAETRPLWARLARLDEALDDAIVEDRERRKQARDAEPRLPPLTPEEHRRQQAEVQRMDAIRHEQSIAAERQAPLPLPADSSRLGKTADEARAEGAEALGRPDLRHDNLIEHLRLIGLAVQERQRQEAAARAARGEREPDRRSGYDRC